MMDDSEALPERRGQQAHARRGADQRESRELQADGSRAGSAANDEIEREVLHRRVEDLLERPSESVDLIDEQDVPGLEICDDRRQVPRPLDGRPRGDANLATHLPGDDVGERCLPEPRRAVEQDVVERFSSFSSRLEKHRQVVFDP